VGGHCIAVDPWFIVHGDPKNARIIRTAREVNDAKTDHVVARASDLIDEALGGDIACLGLAFKANIDDFRESPAVKVAARLARRYGRRIKLVEPYASDLPMDFVGTGAELMDLDSALERCSTFIVLVDHDLFRSVPLEERADKLVYDTRGIWPDQPPFREVRPLIAGAA
jgi:UDP-N-acetyl-D-mannosaminuronic acid dehydrogenase